MSTTPRGIQIKGDQAKLLESPAETSHEYKIIEDTDEGRVLQTAIEALDSGLHTPQFPGCVYFGESLTDGSWSICLDGDELIVSKRISGSWMRYITLS